jgi:thioredoxin reductase/NAD-dependent dihydropyrimidine dehydrogenase PreA subunit
MIESAPYIVLLVAIWAIYGGLKGRHERKARALRSEAAAAGLTEPASLHPKIDPARCKGCGACVSACPEQPGHFVLGMIRGRVELINPTDCIGHGACRAACPHDAITLVFGTERRGVDLPLVSEEFETNVPGIFIAGELGGMGLIRNAITQGRQAMDVIARRCKENKATGDWLDVLIVGAGPAGFSATLGAKQHGLRYRTIEQDSLGGTVFQFPRGKLVMTQPAELPIVGLVKFRELQKEELLAFWQKVERETGVEIHYSERLDEVHKENDGFRVVTTQGEYRTRHLLLCLGRRGTPRKLGVPGEDQPKVVYRMIDPEQYRGQKVLVVGGGDSALEAACSIAEQPDTTVTLSYRSGAITRAKRKNRERLERMVEDGRIDLLLKSNVKEIHPDRVVLDQEGERIEIPNDAVIINAGGILPAPFLERIGIEVVTKRGEA